jgi:hypothetical protein
LQPHFLRKLDETIPASWRLQSMGAVGALASMKEGIMDKHRFDDLTRALATGTSRRTVLRGMLGGVAAGAGVTLVPHAAGAQDETCIDPFGDCEMEEGATPCCGSYTCTITPAAATR